MQHKVRMTAFLLVALLMLGGVAALAQDTTELQVVWWGSQNRHDRTIQVIEMYEAENPGIDIIYEFAAFGDYWTKLNTQAAGGQLACVMQHDYAYLAEWANRDLLMPLDPFFEAGTIDVSNVDPVYLEGGLVNEQHYGLSLGTNSQSIILDVDAFERAGLELPAPDWTWADFEEIALALHENLGIWGMTSNLAGLPDVQLWKSLYLGHGSLPISLDGSELGYTDDQPLIDYFNMILRLQEAGAIPNPDEFADFNAAGIEGSPIVTGDAAMQYQWSNQVVAIFTTAGEDRNFKLWHLPRPEGGQSENYLKPSMFFSITTGCPQPEEAAKFINFFTNDLEANEILFAERGVPISSVVREHLLPMLDVAGAETFDFLSRVELDNSPIYPADPPGFSDLLNNVYTPLVVEPIIYGQITPEEGAAILRSEGNLILAQNKQ